MTPQRKLTSACSTALFLLGVGSCSSNDTCGPAVASGDLRLTYDGGMTVDYVGVNVGANNDCPDPAAPAGVVSLTIAGEASGAFPLTICVARPDLLQKGPLAIGSGATLVDVLLTANGCDYRIDRAMPITGTLTAEGMCGNGVDPAGFSLTADVAFHLTKTCSGQAPVSAPATLTQTAVVVKS